MEIINNSWFTIQLKLDSLLYNRYWSHSKIYFKIYFIKIYLHAYPVGHKINFIIVQRFFDRCSFPLFSN